MTLLFSFIVFVGTLLSTASATERIALTFPVDCKLGETCFIQNFVDHDAGSGWRDYRCGALSYDGHNGTDIRLRSLAELKAGVAVLAAADGKVLRTRDRMPDISIRAEGAPALSGNDCGNAVVLQHANNWTTQYCHLKRGSVLPLPGTQIKAGQKIAEIGLSGRTEFPHLHFTLYHNDKVIDPQASGLRPGDCGGGKSLWTDVSPHALYADAVPLAFGFADGPVTTEDINRGELDARRPTRNSAALVVYLNAMGLKAGDLQSLFLTGPDGRVLAQNALEPIATSKAVYYEIVGRRRTGDEAWPAGLYQARYTVIRGEDVIRDIRLAIQL